MIKTAIIGVSGFGDVHYKDLVRYSEKGEVQIIGAAIINQDEESKKCEYLKENGCRIFSDYRQMLEELKGQIDICFIPTGISMHAPMSIAAMRAGANVYVEKPAAATIQEILDMQRVEKETGKFTAVGYQTIYQPQVANVKRMLLDGKIGKLKSIKCSALGPRKKSYYDRNNWAGAVKNGNDWVLDSPFNNAFAHFLNLLCFFGGTSFEKSAVIKTVQAGLYKANSRIQNTDTSCIKAITENGLPLQWILIHACDKIFGPEVVIEGEKGKIIWTFENAFLFDVDGNKQEINNYGGVNDRDHIMNALIEKVENKDVFVCDLEIAKAQTLCVNGAHESSPIVIIPQEWVYETGEGEDLQVVVRDIDKVIHKATEEERLIDNTDYSWAITGEVIDMTDYKTFNGGKTGK
jgi:predicted dehydrogenase